MRFVIINPCRSNFLIRYLVLSEKRFPSDFGILSFFLSVEVRKVLIRGVFSKTVFRMREIKMPSSYLLFLSELGS